MLFKLRDNATSLVSQNPFWMRSDDISHVLKWNWHFAAEEHGQGSSVVRIGENEENPTYSTINVTCHWNTFDTILVREEHEALSLLKLWYKDIGPCMCKHYEKESYEEISPCFWCKWPLRQLWKIIRQVIFQLPHKKVVINFWMLRSKDQALLVWGGNDNIYHTTPLSCNIPFWYGQGKFTQKHLSS